jgi:hypothetical protein
MGKPEQSGYGKHPERPKHTADNVHRTYITTTSGMSGFFAVMLWWNPDMGGFYEPWTTGTGRYLTVEEARAEARDWAEAEQVEYRE